MVSLIVMLLTVKLVLVQIKVDELVKVVQLIASKQVIGAFKICADIGENVRVTPRAA